MESFIKKNAQVANIAKPETAKAAY